MRDPLSEPPGSKYPVRQVLSMKSKPLESLVLSGFSWIRQSLGKRLTQMRSRSENCARWLSTFLRSLRSHTIAIFRSQALSEFSGDRALAYRPTYGISRPFHWSRSVCHPFSFDPFRDQHRKSFPVFCYQSHGSIPNVILAAFRAVRTRPCLVFHHAPLRWRASCLPRD
jgi:hypothetical protein